MTHNTTPLTQAITAEIRAEMARHTPQITGIHLAGQIGMSQNYLAKRLRNELPLDLNDLDNICVALGVRFDDLVARALKTLNDS